MPHAFIVKGAPVSTFTTLILVTPTTALPGIVIVPDTIFGPTTPTGDTYNLSLAVNAPSWLASIHIAVLLVKLPPHVPIATEKGTVEPASTFGGVGAVA